MDGPYTYSSKEDAVFKIYFNFIQEGENCTKFIIKLEKENKKNKKEVFKSEYDLEFLAIKTNKKYLEISQFRNCIIDNIDNKKLTIFDIFEDAVYTKWEFPNNDVQNNQSSFTLIIEKEISHNLSLIFYSKYEDAEFIIQNIKDQLLLSELKKSTYENYSEIKYNEKGIIDNMIFLNNKDKDNYIHIIENNFQEKKYRTILFFFDKDDNLIKIIINIINGKNKIYKNHIFIIIYTQNNINELKLNLEAEIKKINKQRRNFFDINNIIILGKENISNLYMLIFQIYCFYNQCGDNILKQYINSSKNNAKIDEYNYSNSIFYFNILLIGKTGSGKSSFINSILGEKKAFTNDIKSSTTFRSNYYIHKKYPIKFIDSCGASGRGQGKLNQEFLDSIYK